MSSDNPAEMKACCDNCRFVQLQEPNPNGGGDSVDLCLRFPDSKPCPPSRWCGEHDLTDRMKSMMHSRQGKRSRGRDFTAE